MPINSANRMLVNGNNSTEYATEYDLNYMASMQSCITRDGKHSTLRYPNEVCTICGERGHWDSICMNDQALLGSPKISATPVSTPMEDPTSAELDARMEAIYLAEDLELASRGIAVVYPYHPEPEIEKLKEQYSHLVNSTKDNAQSDNDDFAMDIAYCESPKSPPKRSPGLWKNLRVVIE